MIHLKIYACVPPQGWAIGTRSYSSIHVTVRCDTCPLLGPVPLRKYSNPILHHAIPWDFPPRLFSVLGHSGLPGLHCPSFMGEYPTLYDIRHDSNLWYQQNATSSLPLGERQQLAQDLVNALAMPSQDTGRCTSFRLRLLFTQYC